MRIQEIKKCNCSRLQNFYIDEKPVIVIHQTLPSPRAEQSKESEMTLAKDPFRGKHIDIRL